MYCYLLVELEPGGEAFAVHVLKAKEPHLTQTNGLDHLKGGDYSIISNCTFKKGCFHAVYGGGTKRGGLLAAMKATLLHPSYTIHIHV